MVFFSPSLLYFDLASALYCSAIFASQFCSVDILALLALLIIITITLFQLWWGHQLFAFVIKLMAENSCRNEVASFYVRCRSFCPFEPLKKIGETWSFVYNISMLSFQESGWYF